MSKTIAVILSTLVAATILIGSYQNVQTQPTKPIFNIEAAQCTESIAVQCAADIEMTVRNCAAAFETQGANVIADIKCAKDLMADKKHCWPCICAQAQKKGWHIIGC